VSDDKDAEDGSDWLASQFNPTEQVPAQPVQPPPAVAVAPPPPPPVAPYVPAQAAPQVPPAAPAPASAPAAPAVSAPAPSAGGGFNWGLRPGGAAAEPPAATPAAPAAPPPVTPPAPPPLVSPPPAAPPVSPPTEPYLAPPTQPSVSEPTKPLSWNDFASTQQAAPAAPPPAPIEQPTEAYTVQPWQPAAATSPVAPATTPISDQPSDPTSAIDSLFGDHQFQDYEEVGVLKTIQIPPTPTTPIEPDPAEPRAPLPRSQKVLMGVAAGLIAVLILIGLFFLGEHLGTAATATTASKSTNAPSATPTPAGTGGPAAPGVQQWNSLQGGECIQPFSSAWAVTFTVVACTADHDAEMVFKGTLPDSSETKYPTATAFQKEITPLCSDSTAINYAAAASVTDLQVSFSYPPNTTSWLAGDRTYYCFVDRVSGGNLPGDLSVPRSS
jgi:hypothetical protein